MNLFCTYFDSNFLSRGSAMIQSLYSNFEHKIIVLALDDNCFNEVKNISNKNLIVLKVKDIFPHFLVTDNKEFFFTLTAYFCKYCMNHYQPKSLTYVDADIYFFQTIDLLLHEVSGASLAFTDHRHNNLLKNRYLKYGKYNVGLNYFLNDSEGNDALNLWCDRCDQHINNPSMNKLSFFSDQNLVDDFDVLFSNFKLITNIGINVAPWNAFNYKFSKIDTEYFVNDNKLICYHFSNLVPLNDGKWDACYTGSIFFLIGTLRTIYIEYIKKISSKRLASFPIKSGLLKRAVGSIIKLLCRHYIYSYEIKKL